MAVAIQELYSRASKAVEVTNSKKAWKDFGYENFETWQADREKCQTDLFWLATEILGYAFVELVHRPITDDFFLTKKPNQPIGKWSTIKERLLLYPRGAFKSSADEADTVQLIIAMPDIRIALLTATEGLGALFVEKVKSFFQIPDDSELTRFQILFFDHCIPAKKKESEDRFTTPARTLKLKEPTLLALGLMASTSGLHFDIAKYDDTVSNSNSGPGTTSEQRKTISDALKLAHALVEPYGYHFYIGTPYASDDAYYYLQQERNDLQVLRRPAWVIKSGSRKTPVADLTESDYDILFPADSKGVERLSYRFLRSEERSDPYLFSCNYLLDPQADKLVKFTDALMESHITQASGLPQVYRCYSTWDFAFSATIGRDFSVGSVGWFDNAGRMFVVDVLRGRYSKSELADKVASQAARWKVEKICIEDAGGSNFLEGDIRRALIRLGYDNCPIEFFPVDSQKGAKNSRAEGLETLLLNDRLWFSTDIPILNDIFREFTKFKPGTKRKDDAVDSIAHLSRNMPPPEEIPKDEKARQEAVWQILAEKELHELIYGVRENTPPPQPESLPMDWDGYPIACASCGFTPCICG